MMSFPKSGLRISLWFTLPVGIATGMLAATIAVGGFVGVPGLIYVIGVPGLIASGTELVTAFVMGLCGSVNWAMHGMIDIRLVFIILAGSLLGVQLGAIGTTYVKPIMGDTHNAIPQRLERGEPIDVVIMVSSRRRKFSAWAEAWMPKIPPEIFVRPSTMDAIFGPKFFSISSTVYSVSSTTS